MRSLIDRRFVLEATTLLIVAVLCAAVANALAARERKVRWSAASSTLPTRAAVSTPTTTATDTAVTAPLTDTSGTVVETAVPVTVATSTVGVTTTAMPLLPPTTTASTTTSAPKVATTTTAAVAPTSTAAATAPPKPALNYPSHPDKAYVEIDGDAVEQLHRQGVRFYDARRTDAYVDGHIPGAVNISVWEADVDDRVKQLYEQNLDPDTPLVIYCSGGNCEDSHTLAQKFWNIGLNNALVYKDGFPDWVARKQAVNKGSNP
jgi:rhodanese-related sulfurtransferase